MLSDEALKDLERTYRRVRVVDWSGHELVFRYPTRDENQLYRRRMESADVDQKVSRDDWLLATLIVSFDDLREVVSVRIAFGSLLDESPALAEASKFTILIQELRGLVEKEHSDELGKALSVRNAVLTISAKGSQNGSGTAPVTASSGPTVAPLPAS
jgi:hypothetical protein